MEKTQKSFINVALVGYGYWGPNLLRVFSECDAVKVLWCCDKRVERLKIVKRKFPAVKTTRSIENILHDDKVDAVIIATPLSTHFILAKKILLFNKHVWLEKPMTENSAQAAQLIALAKSKNKVLFVDHIFLYTQPVSYLKKIIDENVIGKIYHLDSSRINLGLFQPDTNVIWDLAIHDITIMLYLFGKNPKSVFAFGNSHIRKGLDDTAYLRFTFDKKTSAYIRVSWLSPLKIRRTIISGNKKMILYDDLETSEKVKIYDYRVSINKNYKPWSSTSGYQYRTGDIHTPALENKEALKTACEHFIDCILRNKIPLTSGEAGLNCVKILEAASFSLKNKGAEQIL